MPRLILEAHAERKRGTRNTEGHAPGTKPRSLGRRRGQGESTDLHQDLHAFPQLAVVLLHLLAHRRLRSAQGI